MQPSGNHNYQICIFKTCNIRHFLNYGECFNDAKIVLVSIQVKIKKNNDFFSELATHVFIVHLQGKRGSPGRQILRES